jgi:histidyl-tRNA synthetase
MMRDTIPAEEILNKTHAIGQYYGFTPLEVITASASKKNGGDGRRLITYPQSLADLENDQNAETFVNFLKKCQSASCFPTSRHPLFIWHTNIANGRNAPKKSVVQFHAIGTDRAIADVVVIRALIALTRDLFHEEPVIRINSMGDKETRARYARELGVFFKKRAETLPEECVAHAKNDAFLAAELVIAKECNEDLPTPTEHLSDASRKRFEDLLEYLEITETPYELARHLINRGNIWNDVCFEILVGERRVAWGSRYNDLTRHFLYSAPYGAIGAILQIASAGNVVKKNPASKLRFSFVHIGDEAKRLSIKLADDFKKARIPLAQNIGIESLEEQVRLAELRDSPYLLIMGRKEALENSVILRNRKTQEEMILSLSGLIDRLKSFV